MSFKVLHIIDCFLPETMNWLERLLEGSHESCIHHIYSPYYTRTLNRRFHYVGAGINTPYPIPFVNKLKTFFSTKTVKRNLLHYITEHKIGLIHFHFGHVAIQFRDWIQQTGLPFCISMYGFDYEFLVHQNPVTIQYYAELSKLGGHYIAEGNYSSRIIQNYGVPSKQIHKVHLLFRHEVNNTHRVLQLPIRLIQAATYTEKKNQLGLIEILEDRHAGKFIIDFYGEKKDLHYYRELQKSVKGKYKHHIRLQPKLSLPDYLYALREAHFTINLSKRSRNHDTEGGCPVLLKDGMSMGKPAISTNHCDIPELVVHGFNGYLLPENDSPSIRDLLDDLMRLTPKQYLQLSCNARQSVETNIAQKISSKELIRVYSSMV